MMSRQESYRVIRAECMRCRNPRRALGHERDKSRESEEEDFEIGKKANFMRGRKGNLRAFL
jgi:hypothetical protein